jgi:putative endonuclease
MRTYYVYIMASRSGTLYIGVTNDLERRIDEHKNAAVGGFTDRYRVRNLVYFENTDDIGVAIAREKELKGWRRNKKIALVASANPSWRDLSKELFGT